MCLSRLVRVDEISPDGETAYGRDGGRRVGVSLAFLLLDGRPPRPGEWLLAHTGLAVEIVAEGEAAAIREARRRVGSGPSPG